MCVPLTETTNALSLNGKKEKKAKHPFGFGTLQEEVVHFDVSKIVKVVRKNACKTTDREQEQQRQQQKNHVENMKKLSKVDRFMLTTYHQQRQHKALTL